MVNDWTGSRIAIGYALIDVRAVTANFLTLGSLLSNFFWSLGSNSIVRSVPFFMMAGFPKVG